ncbi:hypothetical protein BVRB_030360 [Beta vulgaris subsp. vulgaris]|uniref:Sorting nexin/Vps5-like C-terminal domain-containing protein n=1 Tax=Beta vulgaris subsp. vulgaris TaxID=3555 RepID=A0A0J8AXL3_BETVV|nr:hypothetical protein BVRB_030360 [Beta vulgaris subsp. vulgaris]
MLQRVTEEIQRDCEQFQSEEQTVLKRLAQSFAQIQIAHSQKMIASWQSAIASMSSRQ